MFPYLFLFALCLILAVMLDGIECADSARILVLSLVVVFALSLFAGLRADCVGTDTQEYARPLFEIAISQSSFASFVEQEWQRSWGWTTVDSIEVGYLFLVWLCSRVGSFHLLLFLTAFLIVAPFFSTFVLRRKDMSVAFALFVFLFLYFNMTLNMMRQWISMSLMLLALIGVGGNRRGVKSQVLSVSLLLVAFLFHKTAILGFALWALRACFNRIDPKKLCFAIIVLALAAILSVGSIRDFLIYFGLNSYANYLYGGNIHFSITQTILRLPFFIAAVYLCKYKLLVESESWFYFCLASLGLFSAQIAALGGQAARIGLYVDIFILPTAAALAFEVIRLVSERNLKLTELRSSPSFAPTVLIALYCIAYWGYIYVFKGNSETIPYLLFFAS